MMRDQFTMSCERLRHNSEKIVVGFQSTDNEFPAALFYFPVKCGPYEVGKLYRVTVEELAS